MGYFYDDPHENPDVVKLDIAGKEVPWLVTKSAIDEGKERGIDFDELGAMDEEMTGSEALEHIIDMLMLGRFEFMEADHERPNREDFERAVSPNAIPRILGQINAAFAEAADESIPEEVKKLMEAAQSSASTPPSGSGTATDTD
jgi:hypothetical protein